MYLFGKTGIKHHKGSRKTGDSPEDKSALFLPQFGQH